MQDFFLSLSKEERSNLDAFIRIILEHSGVGYVLLEEKPMTFLPFAQSYQRLSHIPPRIAIRMHKGLPLFQKVMSQLPIKKYSMSVIPVDSENVFIQFIHKKRLKRVIEENEIVFQYVLGCFADTSYLMNEFLKGKRHLYSILSEDVTLVGIVLGFGAKNAMMCSRYEKLLNYSLCCLDQPIRGLPVNVNCNASSVEKNQLLPSIGFSSIEEELLANETQGRSCSSYNLFHYLPKLVFGHYGDQAFEGQIKRYEEAQLKLITLLDSESLTEDFLNLLLSDESEETSQNSTLIFDEIPPVTILGSQNQRREVDKVVSLALLEIYDFYFSGELKEKYFQEYIKGMLEVEQLEELKNKYLYIDSMPKLYAERCAKDVWEKNNKTGPFSFENFDQMHRQFARKLGQLNWQFFREVCSEQLVHQLKENGDETVLFSSAEKEALFDICEQIYQKKESREKNFALDFFKKIYPADNSVKEIVKERLYYKCIEKGKGLPIDKKDLVTLVYVMKNHAGFILNSSLEALVCLDMQRAVKPLRKGLLGLSRGEKGILYVHPDWCGLDLSSYPSNLFVTIDFELKI